MLNEINNMQLHSKDKKNKTKEHALHIISK